MVEYFLSHNLHVMWVAHVYAQAMIQPNACKLRRISMCYMSWITDADTTTVLRLIGLLRRAHSENTKIVGKKADTAFTELELKQSAS